MLKLKTAASPPSTPTASLLYDPFLFVDSLTNRSIPLKDICRSPPTHRLTPAPSHRHSLPQHQQEEELRELDECIAFLRSTMNFKMNALREKLFKEEKKVTAEEEDCGARKIRKKRYIRSLLAEEIEKKSREQLQTYLTSPDHRPDQNLLKIVRNSNFAISKKNISKIVHSLQKREMPNPYMHRQKMDDDERDPFLVKLTHLNSEIKGELREKLRRTGEFLVETHENSLMKLLHSRKEQPQKKEGGKQNGGFRDLSWTPVIINADIMSKKRKKGNGKDKVLNKIETELIRLVGSSDLTSVQVYTAKCKKDILKVVDQKGNNLLHIAASCNKAATFEWLLSNLGITSLLQKNEEGMTPVDLSLKLNHRQVINHIPRSMI